MATASILPLSVFSLTATPEPPPLHPRAKRRKTSPQQGRALQVLGHAIEYLIDSRLCEGGATPTDNQAIRMLMACSRTVFAEAAEVVPVHQRVGLWMQEQLRKRTA